MSHSHSDAPSDWITRWAPLIPAGTRVLDVAAGKGRHARWLAAHGYAVDAVDRDAGALGALADMPAITTYCADIESGEWPFRRGIIIKIIVIIISMYTVKRN